MGSIEAADAQESTGNQANENQDRGNPAESDSICRAHIIEKACEQTRHSHGNANPRRHSANEQQQALPHNQQQQIHSRRAKSTANPDLARAASHLIREQTVDADTRQGQPQRAEKAKQPRDQPLIEEGPSTISDCVLIWITGKLLST